MALIVKDRVQETTSTTGTGTLTLSGAVSGFKTFSAQIGNANTTYYAITDGTDWEVGIGTVGAGTLSRDTVLDSSTGSAVAFSAGIKNVFCTYPAGKSVTLDDVQTLTNKTLTSPTLTAPVLGTPSSGNLANCTFPTLNQNTTGSSGSCTGNSATATTATNQSGGTVAATTGTFTTSLGLSRATSANAFTLACTDTAANAYIESSWQAGTAISYIWQATPASTSWGGASSFNLQCAGNFYVTTNAGTGGGTISLGGNITSTGSVSATNITSGGNVTGSSASCTGNAATATQAQNLFVNRSAGAATGIAWYTSSYTAWSQYMSPAAATGCGVFGNITAPTGTYVTSWGMRSFIENSAGYGWTFESGTSSQTTPTIVAEIRSSDGSARFTGNVTAYSDERVKTNWRPVVNDFVEKLARVKSGIYDRTDVELTQAGVSAQSLKLVLPESIVESEDKDAYIAVAYGNAALVSAIELAKELVMLKELVKELKAEVNELRNNK